MLNGSQVVIYIAYTLPRNRADLKSWGTRPQGNLCGGQYGSVKEKEGRSHEVR